MARLFVRVGVPVWALLSVASIWAADTKKPDNTPPSRTGSAPRAETRPTFAASKVAGSGITPASAPNASPQQRQIDAKRHALEARINEDAASSPAARNAAAAQAAQEQAMRATEYQRRLLEQRRAQEQQYYSNRYSNDYYNNYSPYNQAPYGTTYPYAYSGYNSQYVYPYNSGYANPYYASYGNGYSYGSNPYMNFNYPPMVFAPAGQLYGLGPIQQLMGVDGWFNLRQANGNFNGNGNGSVNPGLGAGNAQANARANRNADVPDHKPVDRAPGGKALELAWKFISFGDAHFGNQKFNDALERYRRATREYPKLADGWFRQGFALAALGKYELAAKAMRRGLEEKPDWASTNFRLSELYRDDSATDKRERIDDMVKAAEAAPTNGDLAFVVGVHLYCDSQPEKAATFFRRAAQISGNDAEVKPFLATDP